MSSNLLTTLLPAMILGAIFALVPGPILTLATMETLKRGLRGGLRILGVFLFAELSVLSVCILICSRIEGMNHYVGALSLFGGAMLVWIGLKNLPKRNAPARSGRPAQDLRLRETILIGLTNPHAYLFWLTVGGSQYLTNGPSFVVGFVGAMTATKFTVVLLVNRSRRHLQAGSHFYVQAALATLLLGFGASFLWKGMKGF